MQNKSNREPEALPFSSKKMEGSTGIKLYFFCFMNTLYWSQRGISKFSFLNWTEPGISEKHFQLDAHSGKIKFARWLSWKEKMVGKCLCIMNNMLSRGLPASTPGRNRHRKQKSFPWTCLPKKCFWLGSNVWLECERNIKWWRWQYGKRIAHKKSSVQRKHIQLCWVGNTPRFIVKSEQQVSLKYYIGHEHIGKKMTRISIIPIIITRNKQ